MLTSIQYKQVLLKYLNIYIFVKRYFVLYHKLFINCYPLYSHNYFCYFLVLNLIVFLFCLFIDDLLVEVHFEHRHLGSIAAACRGPFGSRPEWAVASASARLAAGIHARRPRNYKQ